MVFFLLILELLKHEFQAAAFKNYNLDKARIHAKQEASWWFNVIKEASLPLPLINSMILGSWAWVAQIKYWRNGRYEFVCAGTLIADRWILTAAQCLSDE